MDEILKKLVKHYNSFSQRIGKFDYRIDGLDALLIWQFVRFSESYQLHYKSYLEDKELLSEELSQSIFCWMMGMSEPVDFESPELPLGFYFQQTLVKVFDARHFVYEENYRKRIMKYIGPYILRGSKYFPLDDIDPVIGFAVKLTDDPDTVAKFIKQELTELRKHRPMLKVAEHLKKQDKESKGASESKDKDEAEDIEVDGFIKVRGGSILIDWLISYYYREVINLSWSKVGQKHKELTGKKPDISQMKEQIRKFKHLSKHSPYSFFLATY